MTGTLAWLGTQLHIAGTVLAAIITDKSAPARQVLAYTVVLAVLAYTVPKIIKLVTN
jgi:hypothetical protein